MSEIIKINFGSGPRKKEGYKNCDIRPLDGVDYVCHAKDISAHVKHGSVSECFSRHFLEHLTFKEAVQTLEGWRCILVNEGKIDIEVPNLEYHAAQMIEDPEGPCPIPNRGSTTNMQHAMAGFYGWQNVDEHGNDWDIHKSGYTPKSLRNLLFWLGFTDIRQVQVEPWNLRMVAYK